jgi:hypothetical protein
MAKVTLNTLTSGFQSQTLLNANFDSIETELQDKVLYRNNPAGEPNSMQNDLDMNGYNLLNLGNVTVVASASVTQAVMWGTQRDGTGTHSMSASDIYRYTEFSASSSVTAVANISIATTGNWVSGNWIGFIQKGLGPILITPEVGVTINKKGTGRTNGQYAQAILKYFGSNTWYLSGDLSAS